MGFLNADRVKETSTTTGTGTYTLAGAMNGFRSFATIGNTNRCTYCVTNDTDWEVNEGVYTAAGTTLSRDKFLASSTGSAINWTAGTRRVFCIETALASNPTTKYLTADHTLAATTGTAVAGLQLTDLRVGTYVVTYWLIVQSSAAGTGIGLGLNFTGTAAAPVITMRHNGGTGAAATTGVMAATTNVGTGTIVEGRAAVAYSTTAPNMLNTGGVALANTDILVHVEAIIRVTVAGNLELWHSSETAANTSVMTGSSVIVHRVN